MRTKLPFAAVVGVAVLGLAACGGSNDEATNTSLNPLGSSTAFRTIPPTTTTLSVSSDASNTGVIGGEQSYTIVSGDFPIAVARKLGCESWDLIAAFNELNPDPNEFPFPGTVLKVPPDCAGEPVDETTETSTATATSEATATTGTDGSANYTVQAGDTISGIASNFDVSIDALTAANGWTDGANHAIFPGDTIIIPGPATAG